MCTVYSLIIHINGRDCHHQLQPVKAFDLSQIGEEVESWSWEGPERRYTKAGHPAGACLFCLLYINVRRPLRTGGFS